jgi:hypothetical protein
MPIELVNELMPGQEFMIQNLRFRVTCETDPEQYEVFDEDGDYVAYIRCMNGLLFARPTKLKAEGSNREIDWSGDPIYKEQYEENYVSSIKKREETLDKIATAIHDNLKY